MTNPLNASALRAARAIVVALLALATAASGFALLPGAGAASAPSLIPLYRSDDSVDWKWSASYTPGSRFAIVLDATGESQFLGQFTGQARRVVERAVRAQAPDYSREALAVVFLGERPTSGYAVQIRTIDALGEHLTVQFVARSPAQGEVVTQALTYPVDVVKFSKTQIQKPPWDVRFIDQGRLVEQKTVWPATQSQAPSDPTANAPRSIVHYVVARGDTYTAVAARVGTTVPRLRALNPGVDPDNLQIGQRIVVDARAPVDPLRSYWVRPGDTLYRIGRWSGTTVQQLLRLNRLAAPELLQAGSIILVRG